MKRLCSLCGELVDMDSPSIIVLPSRNGAATQRPLVKDTSTNRVHKLKSRKETEKRLLANANEEKR
jgi:hypothetical protein